MPRPARSLWVARPYARRRHRSWMLAMTFASLGWGVWWVMLFLRRLFDVTLATSWPSVLSTAFAICGLALTFWCLRAQRSWLLFVAIPLLANGALLFMPWLAEGLWRSPD